MTLEPVRSPDGREWRVTVRRIGWPQWRKSGYDPELEEPGFIVLGYLAAPFFWFVIPLVLVIAETPVALVRAIRSHRRWIDARRARTTTEPERGMSAFRRGQAASAGTASTPGR